jgi:hypothetical protein
MDWSFKALRHLDKNFSTMMQILEEPLGKEEERRVRECFPQTTLNNMLKSKIANLKKRNVVQEG